jgi:hypothetical protein
VRGRHQLQRAHSGCSFDATSNWLIPAYLGTQCMEMSLSMAPRVPSPEPTSSSTSGPGGVLLGDPRLPQIFGYWIAGFADNGPRTLAFLVSIGWVYAGHVGCFVAPLAPALATLRHGHELSFFFENRPRSLTFQ